MSGWLGGLNESLEYGNWFVEFEVGFVEYGEVVDDVG